MVPVTIRLRRPRPHNDVVQWPIIRITDWAHVLLSRNPEFMLGGMRLHEDALGWQTMLSNFWQEYKCIDGSHPVFHLDGFDPAFSIPYALHGDEGAGLRKKPFLVESFQPIISVKGPFHTNESGWLAEFCTC